MGLVSRFLCSKFSTRLFGILVIWGNLSSTVLPPSQSRLKYACAPLPPPQGLDSFLILLTGNSVAWVSHLTGLST